MRRRGFRPASILRFVPSRPGFWDWAMALLRTALLQPLFQAAGLSHERRNAEKSSAQSSSL